MSAIPGSQQLNGFLHYLRENPSCLFPVDSEKIADHFRNYFGLQTPLELPDILRFFDDLGIEVSTQTELPGNARGYHQICNSQIDIIYLEDEWEGGITHTLFHELFEVIIDLFNMRVLSEIEIVRTEYNANLFAASVLMPRIEFLAFAAKANFDIELIRQKYYQSYFSLLIRLNYLLKSKFFYVGFTVKNEGTYPYRYSDDENEEFESFVINETTKQISKASCLHYFGQAYDAIFSQEDDKSTVRMIVESEYGHENLMVATPVLNSRGRVRQVVIHIMDNYDAEQFRKQFTNSGLRSNSEIIEGVCDEIYETMGAEYAKEVS